MTRLRSAIYRGSVTHARHTPRKHRFSYSIFQIYIDLDELPTLFDRAWLWSFERWNVASFRRKHFLRGSDGVQGRDLKGAVRERVREATGVEPPNGPIGLLTNLAYFGFSFNPVSFYYLFEEDGETLYAMVAEITNTPWKERFQYVLLASSAGGDDEYKEWTFDKGFHVSPFFDMDQHYRWRFTTPRTAVGSRLAVAMENRVGPLVGARGADAGERVFDATLVLERHEFTSANLRGCLLRHPWMTGKALGAIYWQALCLWVKRVPFFPHPDTV